MLPTPLYADELVWSEDVIDIDGNLRSAGFGEYTCRYVTVLVSVLANSCCNICIKNEGYIVVCCINVVYCIWWHRSINSSGAFRLDVEYLRTPSTAAAGGFGDISSIASTHHSTNLYTSRLSAGAGSIAGSVSGMTAAAGSAGGSPFTLRVRLVDSTSPSMADESTTRSGSSINSRVPRTQQQQGADPYAMPTDRWELTHPLTVANHVKCQSGQAYVGIDAVGLLLPRHRNMSIHTASTTENNTVDSTADGDTPISSFAVRILQLSLISQGALGTTNPVTSAATATRHPETAACILEEVNRVRAWMNMKLQLNFPPMFRVIFDADAVAGYERIFSVIMKVQYYSGVYYYFIILLL